MSHGASRSLGRDASRGGGGHSGGTFTGARRFQASPQPARAHSPHPPAPNPIRAWHRLSNRLTNAAPPIAGRPGRGLSYQASLRGPTFKSLKLFQQRARPRFAGVEGASRWDTGYTVFFTVKSWSNYQTVLLPVSRYYTFIPTQTSTP